MKIEVDKPLIHFPPLNMNGKGRIFLLIKYEKIGFFCEVCGILGHIKEECGDVIHASEAIEYGTWMVAKSRAFSKGQSYQRGGGSAWARGVPPRARKKLRQGCRT